jgi:hypothetical protein
MNDEKSREARNSIVREQFTDAQLKGARWNLPGWSELNDRLDREGYEGPGMVNLTLLDAPKAPGQG